MSIETTRGDMETPQDAVEWFREYIAGAKWQEAKSGPPHHYTVRSWQPDTFERAVLLIRSYGVGERFWSKTYTYFYYEGYKYWTMGAPLDKTIIINRASAGVHYGGPGVQPSKPVGPRQMTLPEFQ